MTVRAAVVVLPVVGDGAEGPAVAELDECLTTLVAAADEAAARGTPVVLVAALRDDGAPAGLPLLRRWQRLSAALDAVAVVPVAVSGPGARRQGAAAGLADPLVRGLEPAQVLLLTTGAASAVGVDWVVRHAGHVDGGAAASTAPVRGGAPVGDGGAGHRLAANLAVRADAYLAVGGFAAVDAGEDRLLWEALLRGGYRVCRALDPAVTVRRHPSGARTR